MPLSATIPASGELVRLIQTPTPLVRTISRGAVPGGGSGFGTVTSVALEAPDIFEVGGSPVTTAGTLELTLADQAANTVLAGPTTGSDDTPSFRALVADDIPALPYLDEVGLEMPSDHFDVTNTPITPMSPDTTLAVAWKDQGEGMFLAGPIGGGIPVFRAINASDYSTAVANSDNDPFNGGVLSCLDATLGIFKWVPQVEGGGVASVVQGTGPVTVDNTDPSNPVINSDTVPTITYVDLADTAVLNSANAYTDTAASAVLNMANSYTDSAVAGLVSDVSATPPLSSTGGPTPTISIADAAADGTTKGAATFTANDFNSTAGLISIDYTNGQAATGAQNGFLTAADWTTFNSKQSALTLTNLSSTEITVANGTGAVIGASPVTLTIMNNAIVTAKILDANVTYAKIQNVSAASKLLGRGDSGAGVTQEITLGPNLTMTGTTLDAVSSGSMAIGGSITSATAGSVLFAGTLGVLAQDNTHFFWDDANDRLNLGSGANAGAGTSTLNVTTSTGGETELTLEYKPAGAGTIADAVTLRLALKSSTTANRDAAGIVSQWSTATDASRTSYMSFQTAYDGGSNITRLSLAYTEVTAKTISLSADVSNSGLALVPAGTGAFSLRIPDGGTSGGNARGSNAIDLQTDISAATQVASGTGSVVIGRRNTAAIDDAVAIGKGNAVAVNNGIGIGLSNTVSTGAGNIAIGDNNTSSSAVGSVVIGSTSVGSAAYCLATGFEAVASLFGQNARANGKITTAGDAQTSDLLWKGQTTNNTPTEIFLDGSAARASIGANRLWGFKGTVTALRDDASEGAMYDVIGCIRNDAGVVAAVGAIVVTPIGEDDVLWDVAVTADNTNDCLGISVTGNTGKNINWVASFWLTEVAV